MLKKVTLTLRDKHTNKLISFLQFRKFKKFFNMSIRFSSAMFRPFWAKFFVKLISLTNDLIQEMSKQYM